MHLILECSYGLGKDLHLNSTVEYLYVWWAGGLVALIHVLYCYLFFMFDMHKICIPFILASGGFRCLMYR
jgi:hypothetical protein